MRIGGVRARLTLALAVVSLGLVAMFALLGAPAEASNGPAKGATYAGLAGRVPGTFRRGEAVTFKVAKNGKHVLNFITRLGYDGKCGQGGGPNYTVQAASIPLGSSGRFQAVVTASLGPFKAKVKISGQIKGRKASGVVEQIPPNTCNSGPNAGANAYSETFTARAK